MSQDTPQGSTAASVTPTPPPSTSIINAIYKLTCLMQQNPSRAQPILSLIELYYHEHIQTQSDDDSVNGSLTKIVSQIEGIHCYINSLSGQSLHLLETITGSLQSLQPILSRLPATDAPLADKICTLQRQISQSRQLVDVKVTSGSAAPKFGSSLLPPISKAALSPVMNATFEGEKNINSEPITRETCTSADQIRKNIATPASTQGEQQNNITLQGKGKSHAVKDSIDSILNKRNRFIEWVVNRVKTQRITSAIAIHPDGNNMRTDVLIRRENGEMDELKNFDNNSLGVTEHVEVCHALRMNPHSAGIKLTRRLEDFLYQITVTEKELGISKSFINLDSPIPNRILSDEIEASSSKRRKVRPYQEGNGADDVFLNLSLPPSTQDPQSWLGRNRQEVEDDE